MAERGAAATGDLLVLMQWLSPAFPVGGFAYSHGLEWAISAGEVTGAAELCEWLSDVLEHGAGRVDATLLAQAMDPAADLDGLADLARALAPSAERLAETEDQGAAFARAVSATGPGEVAAMPFPVAFGAAARGLDVAPAQAAALYLHAMVSNLVSGAVRFIPLGQTAGQRALAALHPVIEAVAAAAAAAAAAPPGAVASTALGADLAAMRHETMEVRIFRS
jgi:urease accessory protein